jgi:hypothetical protein
MTTTLKQHLACLGAQALDPITGLKGTVYVINFHNSGLVQYTIQPKGLTKDGDPIEGRDVDFQNLKISGKPTKAVVFADQIIWPGDEVEYVLAPIKGVVRQTSFFMNGCIYGAVQQRELDEKGFLRKLLFVSQNELTVKKEGAQHVAAKSASEAEPAPRKRPPGGPSDRPLSRS